VDILLLVGPVVQSQYQPVFNIMSNRGLDPNILFVSDKLASDGDFHEVAAGKLPNGIHGDEATEFADEWIETEKARILKEGLGEYSLADVTDVVSYADNEGYPSTVYMDWLFDGLPAFVRHHKVHVGENCEVWIDGDFGRLEPDLNISNVNS